MLAPPGSTELAKLGDKATAEQYAAVVQSSLDHGFEAGTAYPFAFQFRTAQAQQIFALSQTNIGFRPPALMSINHALYFDPGSVALIGAKAQLTKHLGHCDEADATTARLVKLAPTNPQVMKIAHLPCAGRP